jgi:16S rRNA (adenine1518-N6/adenine1519-N6)-dimethyltransferase
VATFAVIDAAFAQRRKTLRSALATWAGSAAAAEEIVRAAGVDPSERGERLGVEDFAAIAAARAAVAGAGDVSDGADAHVPTDQAPTTKDES